MSVAGSAMSASSARGTHEAPEELDRLHPAVLKEKKTECLKYISVSHSDVIAPEVVLPMSATDATGNSPASVSSMHIKCDGRKHARPGRKRSLCCDCTAVPVPHGASTRTQ